MHPVSACKDAINAKRNVQHYHLRELAIANDPSDPRRNMPHLEETDRRILDVGCGAGQTLIASAPVAEVLAVGVDFRPFSASVRLKSHVDGTSL